MILSDTLQQDFCQIQSGAYERKMLYGKANIWRGENVNLYTGLYHRLGYPDESNTLFALKYHINSVIDAIDETLRTCAQATAEN